MSLRFLLLFFPFFLLFSACSQKPSGVIGSIGRFPHVSPDYKQLTIPENIAPLNFKIEEDGDAFFVKIYTDEQHTIEIASGISLIQIPLKKWNELLTKSEFKKLYYDVFIKQDGQWKQFMSFNNTVSEHPIDNYLYYRLLYPGYERWSEISIVKRNLENFSEKVVIDNNVVDQNCVNCHAFNPQNTSNFMFHMRGSMGGTYFVNDGKLEKFRLKTKEMANGAVYPRWHPSGNYVAFSSNKVRQTFHSSNKKKIEVTDLNSSLLLYDLKKNEILDVKIPDKQVMDTYPEWSPDGKSLYFCRFVNTKDTDVYNQIKYDLYRYSFDAKSRKFGDAELVFEASAESKSVSFPRMSPNGKFLVFTSHNYGCFPVWHKEADLYLLNTETQEVEKMNGNSNCAESYHSWAANGRWMVFSSKRGDGLSARPYITFVNESGQASKPFVLPQKDPEFYSNFLKTFNIPELSNADICLSPGEIKSEASKKGIQATWSKN